MSSMIDGLVQSGNKNLSGATVTAKGGGNTYTTKTNAYAQFSFNGLPAGSYDVTASMTGYQNQTNPNTPLNMTIDFNLLVASSTSGSSSSEGDDIPAIDTDPPTNCKITITMDQDAVDTATSAGEYVTIVQTFDGKSIDSFVWVSFAPALTTVVSW